MPVELNHTIVHAVDPDASAAFVVEILNLPAPTHFGPFTVVETSNSVSLDFMASEQEISSQHYAFLVDEDEFDQIFDRIRERGVEFWAEPSGRGRGEINRRDGGRGLYFHDLNGHALEILTRPYGSGGSD